MVSKKKSAVEYSARSVTAVDQTIAARLVQRRTEMGLSQQALGQLAGVTFQQIQKYEKGVNRVAASRLFAIARVLDTPLSYFFEPLSPSRKTSPRAVSAPRQRNEHAMTRGRQKMAQSRDK